MRWTPVVDGVLGERGVVGALGAVGSPLDVVVVVVVVVVVTGLIPAGVPDDVEFAGWLADVEPPGPTGNPVSRQVLDAPDVWAIVGEVRSRMPSNVLPEVSPVATISNVPTRAVMTWSQEPSLLLGGV